jgi:hypothetical protein
MKSQFETGATYQQDFHFAPKHRTTVKMIVIAARGAKHGV